MHKGSLNRLINRLNLVFEILDKHCDIVTGHGVELRSTRDMGQKDAIAKARKSGAKLALFYTRGDMLAFERRAADGFCFSALVLNDSFGIDTYNQAGSKIYSLISRVFAMFNMDVTWDCTSNTPIIIYEMMSMTDEDIDYAMASLQNVFSHYHTPSLDNSDVDPSATTQPATMFGPTIPSISVKNSGIGILGQSGTCKSAIHQSLVDNAKRTIQAGIASVKGVSSGKALMKRNAQAVLADPNSVGVLKEALRQLMDEGEFDVPGAQNSGAGLFPSNGPTPGHVVGSGVVDPGKLKDAFRKIEKVMDDIADFRRDAADAQGNLLDELDDLTKEADRSIGQVRHDSGETLQGFKTALAAKLGILPRIVITDGYDDQIDVAPEQPAFFGQSEANFDRVMRELNSVPPFFFAEAEPLGISILGKPGTGKSTFFTSMMERFPEPVPVIVVDIQSGFTSDRYSRLCKDMEDAEDLRARKAIGRLESHFDDMATRMAEVEDLGLELVATDQTLDDIGGCDALKHEVRVDYARGGVLDMIDAINRSFEGSRDEVTKAIVDLFSGLSSDSYKLHMSCGNDPDKLDPEIKRRFEGDSDHEEPVEVSPVADKKASDEQSGGIDINDLFKPRG